MSDERDFEQLAALREHQERKTMLIIQPDSDLISFYCTLYPEAKAIQAAREETYFNLFGVLPSWSVVIERVETVNGSNIIIHRDPNGRH